MTVRFCNRFLPKCGDRTVDQMIQAARNGKQNIVECCAEGVTSSEMELKLLNIARGSIEELEEDRIDYLRKHSWPLWPTNHPSPNALLRCGRTHNRLEDCEPYFDKWNAEEFSDCAPPIAR